MKCIWQPAFKFVVCNVMYSIQHAKSHAYRCNLVNMHVFRTFIVSRVKYAMNYCSKNSFSMSYASRKVIFPGESFQAKHYMKLMFTHNENSCQWNIINCSSCILGNQGITWIL